MRPAEGQMKGMWTEMDREGQQGKQRDRPLARWLRKWCADLLFVAGAGCVSVGAALIYLPVGLIVGGVCLIAGGVLAAKGGDGDDI